ncbi:MAG: aldehyde dehydrogenase family protein [Acidobacteria bacterium]|nr:MAG: aldehyde dehydrogenase family protein [Acidobacteriota bacterium]
MEKILVDGEWRAAESTGSFKAIDPNTGETLDHEYPVSSRADVDAVLAAGLRASHELRGVAREKVARFLERYADLVDERQDQISEAASLETALPVSPRLKDVELPRTTDQLRQAAAAARDRSWTLPTIDTASNIRSMFGPLEGAVVVFGPNNFPFAFNGVAGGDFAAAIGAGNPVIAKAHPSHPRTSQMLAEAAFEAVEEVGLPAATVQMIYRTSHADGEYLVSHPSVAATGYTGSRSAALKLKAAADRAGKPIYLEMSSVNPVFVLPGSLSERAEAIADELTGSVLLGTGQFCTCPGFVVAQAGEETDSFVTLLRERMEKAGVGALLGVGVVEGLGESVETLVNAGAELVVGGTALEGQGCRFQNTLLRTSGREFLGAPEKLQTEAFGNCSLLVVAEDADQMVTIAGLIEGSLTGSIYSHTGGDDDALCADIADRLRTRVGRLLNDKMPTGVAVVPSMNHGGPYPATGHPGFTSVGIPASLRRFAMLECYDNVREQRLPPELRDENTTADLWRLVDGRWTLS